MPPELRNLVYGSLAINTSLRIISGKKLVAAYQALHSERRPKLERTGLKWHVAGTPMANIKVPIIDLTPLSPAATSRYPLDSVSRQLRAEVPPLVDTFGASEYLFILNNFGLKQMELIAGSIRALDNEARQRDPPVTFDYHMCFVTDDDAVSSAEKLCLYLEENGKVPLGLEYIAYRMAKVQVKTGLTPLQAQRIYAMFSNVRRRTHGGEEALRPITFVESLFERKIRLHWPRGLGRWGMCA